MGKNYRGDNKAFGVLNNTLIEGVLPFKRTPANILARGVEYSPIELIKGLTYDLVQVKKGNMEAYEAIDHIASGLTGTALMGLGAFMSSMGLLTAGGWDDEYDKQTGKQEYALNIGDTSVTLDWLAPEALPLFVGAEFYDAVKEADGDITLSGVLDALGSIADPVLEMSMLQGVQDVIDSAASFNKDESSLLSAAASIVSNYLMQGLPTLFGQIERSFFESTRQSTYPDRKSQIPADIQRAIAKALNKIPGLDYAQMDYVDVWGNKQSTGKWWERAINNFLNPAYVSKIKETPVDKELKRLSEKDFDGVLPKTVPYSQKVQEEYLSRDEYQTYAKERGQTAYEVLSDLFSTDQYKQLPDEDKASAVLDVYEYASAKAKESVSDYESDGWIYKADEAEKVGVSLPSYILYRLELEEIKKGTSPTQEETESVLDRMDMSDRQKAYLWALQNKGWSEKNNPYLDK